MSQPLTHGRTGAVLAERVRFARSWAARARGLIGSEVSAGDAFLLRPCKQVHTFFMRDHIDVVFCDDAGTVLHVIHRMAPWRVSKWVMGARMAIELPAGAAEGVRDGDRVSV